MYLLKNSDLKQIDEENVSVLMLSLMNIKKVKWNKEDWKYLIKNSDLSLITDEKDLLKLKKIQSKFLNEELLSKIDLKK